MTANPRETDFVVSDALDTEIARGERLRTSAGKEVALTLQGPGGPAVERPLRQVRGLAEGSGS
jgi:hypothetical protein